MPYIRNEENRRNDFDFTLDELVSIENKGELEYCVCKLMNKFMKIRDFKYSTLHDCCYAVQHCADEFRRRFLDKREDDARKSNNDVFDFYKDE